MTNEQVTIRFAAPADAARLAEIGRKSFYDAFAAHPANAPEDMEIFMNQSFGEAIQAREIADEKTVYFVAESAGDIIGYAKVRKDSREPMVTGERVLEIARFYFLQEFIGRGASRKLMETVLSFARENKFDTVWLGVWEFNPRAVRFYEKWNFEKIGEHIFQLGNDPQTDWVMQRKV